MLKTALEVTGSAQFLVAEETMRRVLAVPLTVAAMVAASASSQLASYSGRTWRVVRFRL